MPDGAEVKEGPSIPSRVRGTPLCWDCLPPGGHSLVLSEAPFSRNESPQYAPDIDIRPESQHQIRLAFWKS